MFRIRFHGRGGQGIKTASRILGSAFFAEGFEVQDAPRYGAERRGAPMTAYVRASNSPVRERSTIEHPGLICLADITLLHVPAAGVLAGRTRQTIFLLPAGENPAVWKERLSIEGPVLALPDYDLTGRDTFAGAMLAAGAARLTGRIHEASLSRSMELELHTLDPDVRRENLERALFVFHSMEPLSGRLLDDEAAPKQERPDWIDLSLDPVHDAAPGIDGQTSEAVHTGLWRASRPVLNEDHCHSCTWICTTYCPDSAISPVQKGQRLFPAIDYDHCKGCLICCAVCPNHAIAAVRETGAFQ